MAAAFWYKELATISFHIVICAYSSNFEQYFRAYNNATCGVSDHCSRCCQGRTSASPHCANRRLAVATVYAFITAGRRIKRYAGRSPQRSVGSAYRMCRLITECVLSATSLPFVGDVPFSCLAELKPSLTLTVSYWAPSGQGGVPRQGVVLTYLLSFVVDRQLTLSPSLSPPQPLFPSTALVALHRHKC